MININLIGYNMEVCKSSLTRLEQLSNESNPKFIIREFNLYIYKDVKKTVHKLTTIDTIDILVDVELFDHCYLYNKEFRIPKAIINNERLSLEEERDKILYINNVLIRNKNNSLFLSRDVSELFTCLVENYLFEI